MAGVVAGVRGAAGRSLERIRDTPRDTARYPGPVDRDRGVEHDRAPPRVFRLPLAARRCETALERGAARPQLSRPVDLTGRRLARLPYRTSKESMMSKFEQLSDKAITLVGQAGDSLRHAIPDSAEKWLQTGIAIGAAKSGARVAGGFLRRNPAILAASLAGAGLVWLAARQYKKKKENGTIEGSSRRIEAKRAPSRRRTTTRRGPAAASSNQD
ncbi:hypothetical protein [Luteimonas cellulosilyticus]|uniref:hypothetical protein n=2 Tax=Luteimonas TaxID=83614 RepID=UPI00135CA643|nr:hypothetical protein [Luteimonas cellulosilyticus]